MNLSNSTFCNKKDSSLVCQHAIIQSFAKIRGLIDQLRNLIISTFCNKMMNRSKSAEIDLNMLTAPQYFHNFPPVLECEIASAVSSLTWNPIPNSIIYFYKMYLWFRSSYPNILFSFLILH